MGRVTLIRKTCWCVPKKVFPYFFRVGLFRLVALVWRVNERYYVEVVRHWQCCGRC